MQARLLRWFQSPIHRDFFCDEWHGRLDQVELAKFQSPIHRDLFCDERGGGADAALNDGFNPLFIGTSFVTQLRWLDLETLG